MLPAQKALDLATIDAAHGLGAHHEIGSLEPGKRADIVIVDCTRPGMTPTTPTNAVANLVYAGASGGVRDTIVDGRFVLRGGAVVSVDEDSLVRKAAEAGAKLISA